MAFDRPSGNTGKTIGDRTLRPQEADPDVQNDARLLKKATRQLTDSLDNDEPEEKNYHVRMALQTLQIASEKQLD